MKRELIRKTWPKIRSVFIKGEKFFQVDARRLGTNGKRETFAVKSDAQNRAAEIEKEFAGNGNEGLAMPADLRAEAFTAQKILAPFGKSIVQAAEFYRDHLQARQKAQESALVPVLANQWHQDKASGRLKKLRPASLRDIKQTADILAEHFEGVRILDVSTKQISDFLDAQDVGLQRKYNLCNLFSPIFQLVHCAGAH